MDQYEFLMQLVISVSVQWNCQCGILFSISKISVLMHRFQEPMPEIQLTACDATSQTTSRATYQFLLEAAGSAIPVLDKDGRPELKGFTRKKDAYM